MKVHEEHNAWNKKLGQLYFIMNFNSHQKFIHSAIEIFKMIFRGCSSIEFRWIWMDEYRNIAASYKLKVDGSIW
jgi:hypothetical protein